MDKVAVVIGESGLIGSAVGERLQKDGFSVIGTYFNHHKSYTIHRLDITKASEIVKFYEKIGQIDVLVNCAGINLPGSIFAVGEIEFQAVFENNLLAAFSLLKHGYKNFNNNASIVMIGSVSAFNGGPISGHYGASKLGLVALAQNAALMYADRQITVNVVAPGYIKSEMADKASLNPRVQREIDRIPLKRYCTVEDVAGAVSFLCSDDSKYITGQVLHVNGGLVW